jgi:hypothetical protein
MLTKATRAVLVAVAATLVLAGASLAFGEVGARGVVAYPYPYSGKLTASPDSLDFGERPVGVAPDEAMSTVIKNTGAGPVTIESLDIADGNVEDFSFSTGRPGSCEEGTVLLPQESCSVFVFFVPTAAGPRRANLYVAGDGSLATVPLSGTGVASNSLTSSPRSLDFGSKAIDEGRTATEVVRVDNDGTGEVTPSGIAVTGSGADQFQVLQGGAGDCATTTPLAPGEGCEVRVRFDPSAVGEHEAALTVTAPDLDPLTTTLSGLGLTPDGD